MDVYLLDRDVGAPGRIDMVIGGIMLSVLPFVITGQGAGVIDPSIVIGPFILVAGLITYAVGAVGAWHAKRRD